jgi:hypothetical protein
VRLCLKNKKKKEFKVSMGYIAITVSLNKSTGAEGIT